MQAHKNGFRRVFATAVLGALAAWCTMAAVAADTVLTDEGLEAIKIKNVDSVHRRPGVNLGNYSKVLLRPVSVEFSKSWNPRDYGRFGLASRDVEKIRTSLAKLAEESFSKTLSKGGYPIVSEAGEGVLDVEVRIVDLIVNAPDVPSADRSRTYVMNAGEMRMIMTLRDSVAGTLLYRVIDRKRGRETGRLEWASTVWNRAEADLALTGWAAQLKAALDSARTN